MYARVETPGETLLRTPEEGAKTLESTREATFVTRLSGRFVGLVGAENRPTCEPPGRNRTVRRHQL